MLLDHRLLLEHLHYDPVTGVWTRLKKCRRPKAAVGTRADHPKTGQGGVRDVLFMGRCEYSHVLAWLYMTGKWPLRQVDHKNTNTADNRWENLRLATPSQNGANKGKTKSNTSGYKGVSKAGKKWAAHICCQGRNYYLGLFLEPEDAHEAYKKAATKLFGEFANAG